MKPTIRLSLLTFTALLLVGCGGGGGNPSAPQRTGSVGDGYIEGAYVCHDSNQDWDCLDEIYATTAADGSFTLSNYDQTKDLLVQVPVGAQDNGPFVDGSTAAKTITSPVWYSYPAGANPSGSPIFVGPLSTLVYAQLHAIPGTTVTDAVNIVSAGLGVDANQTLENYIEDNNTQLHALGEVAGGAIANTTSTGSTPQPNYDAVLGDLHGIASYAAASSSSGYDPAEYTPSGYTASGNTPALGFSQVLDLHRLLAACDLKAFEEWDNNSVATPNEHKELCLVTDADTGAQRLDYTEKYYNANTWTLDTLQTSGQVPFLSRPADTLVDMDHVNSATQPDTYPLRFFPAVEQSHSGGSAIFKSGILSYKLVVSQADINGVSGSNLPKGPSIDPLINGVTFGSGDILYHAIMIIQERMFRVDNGHDFFHGTTTSSTHSEDYIVYDEGTLGGAGFSLMPNSTDIVTMMGLTDTDFIVGYQDSNNFTKISVTSPYNPNNTLNALQIEHINNGSNGGVVSTAFYNIENHNGTSFLVIHDFFGPGQDIFIGKVSSIDPTHFIYGEVSPAGVAIDITEGGYQNGDIMDDIMLNTSARDRVLNTASIAIP